MALRQIEYICKAKPKMTCIFWIQPYLQQCSQTQAFVFLISESHCVSETQSIGPCLRLQVKFRQTANDRELGGGSFAFPHWCDHIVKSNWLRTIGCAVKKHAIGKGALLCGRTYAWQAESLRFYLWHLQLLATHGEMYSFTTKSHKDWTHVERTGGFSVACAYNFSLFVFCMLKYIE